MNPSQREEPRQRKDLFSFGEPLAGTPEKPTASVSLTYPDGTRKSAPRGIMAGEALALPSGKLPEGVIAALVDGRPGDLSRPLETDADIRSGTFGMPEGKE